MLDLCTEKVLNKKWKIQTNTNKFKMIMIANIPKQNIFVDNITLEYSNKAKILGLHQETF